MNLTLFDEFQREYPDGLLLLDSVTVIAVNEGSLDFVGQLPFRVSGLHPQEIELVRKLRTGLSWDEIGATSLGAPGQQLLYELHRRRLLVRRELPSVAAMAGPLERQVFWLSHFVPSPAAALEKLRQQHVVIVGCGGTGALAVQHLIAMGVGTLTLLDFDVVAESNLNRQFPFRMRDVGRPKAQVLRDYVLEHQPSCDVRTVDRRVETADDVLVDLGAPAVSAVFCCADQPVGQINAVVCEAALRLKAACIFGNVGLLDGSVGPLLFEDTVMRRYMLAMRKRGEIAARAVGSPIMKSSFAPVNTVIAALMAFYWSCHLLGVVASQALNQTLVVDLSTMVTSIEKVWTDTTT